MMASMWNNSNNRNGDSNYLIKRACAIYNRAPEDAARKYYEKLVKLDVVSGIERKGPVRIKHGKNGWQYEYNVMKKGDEMINYVKKGDEKESVYNAMFTYGIGKHPRSLVAPDAQNDTPQFKADFARKMKKMKGTRFEYAFTGTG